MKINAEIFAKELQKWLDRRVMSPEELAKASGVHKTTVYRALKGSGLGVDRATIRKIVAGFGLEVEIQGQNIRLYEDVKKDVEFGEESSDRFRSGVENRKGEVIRRMIERLKEVDVESLEMCERLMNVLLNLDKRSLIEIDKLVEKLDAGANEKVFVEKMKAFASLVMPYEAMNHEKERQES